MDLVVLASGDSRRFLGNKLFAKAGDKKMYAHMADIYDAAYPFENKVIVSKYDEILENLGERGYIPVFNDDSSMGKSYSIKLGLEKLGKHKNKSVLFAVCDQPLLRARTIAGLITAYETSGKTLAGIRFGEKIGNPCIFSYQWYDALLQLVGESGGKQIILQNLEDMCFYDIEHKEEMMDIDTYEKYEMYREKIHGVGGI